jgi:hypothetical protein
LCRRETDYRAANRESFVQGGNQLAQNRAVAIWTSLFGIGFLRILAAFSAICYTSRAIY